MGGNECGGRMRADIEGALKILKFLDRDGCPLCFVGELRGSN